MTIRKTNIQMSLIIPKELKQELKQVADSQNRSLNNLINTVLMDYLNNKKA
jgi:predicted HicB family RNase H-like nuclease